MISTNHKITISLGILLLQILFAVSACKRNITIKDTPCQIIDSNCVHSTKIPAFCPAIILPEIDNSQKHCGILPISKKNYWIYLDSLFDITGQFTQIKIDTLRFIKAHMSPDSITWWSTNNTFKGFLQYSYSTDSVLYTLGTNWGGKPVVKWFHYMNTDSTSENCNYTDHPTICEAKKLYQAVIVPAGKFNNCLLFTKKWILPELLNIYFKPGIGVLRFE
jgi:hypothetical protein